METEEKRAKIRAMLGEMEMSYRDASRELGINNSALGYILTSKKVAGVYNAVYKKYQEYKEKS